MGTLVVVEMIVENRSKQVLYTIENLNRYGNNMP